MDSKTRVLIVDEEPAIVRFVKIGLSLAGYDVVSAGGGAQALELIEETRPDIVLLDLGRAPADRYAVIETLRVRSKLPLIAFSAHSDSADLAFKKGANAFVRKPFKPEQLKEIIENTLKGKSLTALNN